MLRILTAIALALAFVTVTACITEDDLTLDQRHRQLSEQLMCPVCDGQTIDQSSATISEDMKSVIWQQLDEGRSNVEIRQYFVDRYGEAVLAAPTGSGLNITVWTLPLVVAIAGLAIVGAAYLRMRIPKASAAASETDGQSGEGNSDTESDPALNPYLERVDAELDSAIGKSTQRN